MAKLSPFLRLKRKGYAITRIGKEDASFTGENSPNTLQNAQEKPLSDVQTELKEEVSE